MNNRIDLFETTLINKTQVILTLNKEKKDFEDKAEKLERELSLVKAELRRTVNDKEIFESELNELTKTAPINKLESESKTVELSNNNSSIRASLIKSESICAQMSAELKIEKEKVKEKESKIEVLRQQIDVSEDLLAKNEKSYIEASTKFKLEAE